MTKIVPSSPVDGKPPEAGVVASVDDAPLARLSAATRALAECKTLPEVKAIIDIAAAAATYARAAKLGLKAQNHAAEVKLRAERAAGDMLRQLERGAGNPNRDEPTGRLASSTGRMVDPSPYASTLADVGATRQDAHRWQTEATVPDVTFEAHVAETVARGGELTSAGVLRLARDLNNEAQPRPAPPTGQYAVLYADPPWEYDFATSPTREIENQYQTMPLGEIVTLPVPAAPDSVLFLWATSPKLIEALSVMSAWGFTYRTCMVWVKDRIGMGYYARQRHELLLIGRRGDLPVPEPSNRPDSVIEAPRLEHSAKPDVVYGLIERMYPTDSRIELFARCRREGWAAWGNEV